MDSNKKIKSKMEDIESENNIIKRYEMINSLHELIKEEESKLNNFYEKLDNIEENKYSDVEIDKLMSKLDKTDNLEKKIKYFHSLSTKIDNIIKSISV